MKWGCVLEALRQARIAKTVLRRLIQEERAQISALLEAVFSQAAITAKLHRPRLPPTAI
jgi:hypothetical protein